ncbi:uncharacterized protein V6R79_006895 [Siganus canaliculatus]
MMSEVRGRSLTRRPQKNLQQTPSPQDQNLVQSGAGSGPVPWSCLVPQVEGSEQLSVEQTFRKVQERNI